MAIFGHISRKGICTDFRKEHLVIIIGARLLFWETGRLQDGKKLLAEVTACLLSKKRAWNVSLLAAHISGSIERACGGFTGIPFGICWSVCPEWGHFLPHSFSSCWEVSLCPFSVLRVLSGFAFFFRALRVHSSEALFLRIVAELDLCSKASGGQCRYRFSLSLSVKVERKIAERQFC